MTRAEAFALKLRVLGALSLRTPRSVGFIARDIERAEPQVYYYLRQLAEDGFAQSQRGPGGGWVLTEAGRAVLAEGVGLDRA